MNILKRSILFFVALLFFVLAWYGLQRGLASGRQIDVIKLTSLSETTLIGETLRVGAYNIAHGRRGRLGESNWRGETREAREKHLSEISAQIAAADLDVVVLNEVDFDADWSGNIDQAVYLAERSGFPYLTTLRNIDIALPFFKLQFGNAILSKVPLKDVKAISLPAFKQWEALLGGKKDALVATIEYNKRAIHIVAIHLDTRDKDIRLESIERLREAFTASDNPFVLLGDFNSQLSELDTKEPPSALDVLIYDAGFTTDVDANTWKTFPSESPRYGIDWILASPPLRTHPSKVVPSFLSDHLMVISEISFED